MVGIMLFMLLRLCVPQSQKVVVCSRGLAAQLQAAVQLWNICKSAGLLLHTWVGG